jgi:hypothetical protein
MKKVLPLIFLFILGGFQSNAQSEVFLIVNHFLGDQVFESNTACTVDAGYQMKVNRLEYYLSDFVITHDGGVETSLDGVHLLVDAEDPETMSLGEWDIVNVEGITYSVGVHPDYNHLDPASYDWNDPLAPQSPSMQWGWAAGYRFVAFEGKSGPNLTTTFEVHALGDSNFMSQTIDMSAASMSGILNLYVDADYIQLVNDLDVSTGLIEHSESGAAVDLLMNMNALVFSAGAPVGINDAAASSFSVYPNPANTNFQIQPKGDWSNFQLNVFNSNGQLVHAQGQCNGLQVLDGSAYGSGLYFIQLTNENGQTQSSRLVIQ